MQTRKKGEIGTRDIHLNAKTNWKKQTHSNLQPEEKEARGWKTSCQKKMSGRKHIEESAEYKIFKTGSSAIDRKYGNADTRDILIRVGSAQIYQHSSFKIC